MLSYLCFITAALFFAAAAHPFVTYRLSLSFMRYFKLVSRSRPVPGAGRPVSSFAICVCAYNEEAVIADKVANLLACRDAAGLPVEILIYVDAASDRTAEILRPFADRLRLVVATERRGKSAGMNRLVGMCSADVVVFSDANVMMAEDSLRRLRPYFDDPTVGCVCGHLVYTNGGSTPTAAVGSAYWRTEETIKQLESDTGGVIGADGSIFAIRRSLHRPTPEDIIDDFYLSLSILCDGHRVVRAADVLASETSATDSADEFRRKVRIACQAFNVHRLIRKRLAQLPWLLRYKYLSHKLLRWLSLLHAGLAGLFLVIGVTAWRGWQSGLLAALVGGLGLAILLTGRQPLVIRSREVLLALMATTLGVIRSLRGDRFQTWLPPASRTLRASD